MSEYEAAIWEEQLIVPTYQVGPADPNPIFYEGRGYQGAKGPVYPYAMLDRLTDVKQEKAYRAVYLENRYIKLCVLPEIGGRIFAGLDKTNGYDFIYRQHVIKPALIGMLGAWISGGVEWNIPHHHRPTTFMPADYCLTGQPGRPKTLWIGEIERRHRMKWIVGLTVYPDRSYLEVTTRIFNRTPYAHSFLCFTNVAVSVNDDYQVIFPPGAEWGTQHAKCEFIRWPMAGGVYAGVDYSKLPAAGRVPAGVDVSWWRNHPSPLSIFAWNYQDDFFGGYDHGKQAGILHVAEHRSVPGKKFFTFGNGPRGWMWDKILTDADGPYLELMAGAYSDNQPDYSWIQPHEMKTATQHWYPIRELGGACKANRDAAVNLSVEPGKHARLAFNATAEHSDAEVVLQVGRGILFRQKIAIGPDRPFARELALPVSAKPEDLQAALLDSAGRELISYQPAPRKGAPMPELVQPPPPPEQIPTNEELYLAGLRLEQFHSPAMEPYPYYEEALRRDGEDSRVNIALGILYCKRGMYAQAEERLRSAVRRLTRNHTSPKDGEALYYLGLALRARGDSSAAKDALGKAVWSFAWRAAGHYALAEMALCEGDPGSAMRHVEECIACNALDTAAAGLKAALLRKSLRFEEAAQVAAAALALDPLDFRARMERVLALGRAGKNEQARRESDDLASLMGGQVQSYLELACDYERCGLWDEATEVLTRWLDQLPAGRDAYPMVHYALGYYHEKKGQGQEAAKHYRLAKLAPADYCFPFRLEAAEWLRAAIRHDPADSRAPYYLGNLLFDHQPTEAIQAWEQSRRLDGSFATVHRNLGLAYARIEKDYPKAIASLKQAIACSPGPGGDARLYAEMDRLMEAEGLPHRERLSRLEQHHEVVVQRDDALLREIRLHVFVGQYDRAIELLEDHHFHIWEGAEGRVHDAYVDAHLLKGRQLLAAGHGADALGHYQAALEYPDRFEMGAPYDGGRAPEAQYLIGTAWEALGQAEKAHSAFQLAVERERRESYLSFYQGLAYRKLGREIEAAERFRELTRLGDEMRAGEKGTDFFEKFGARQTESVRQAEAHYLRGLGLQGSGDPAGAKREFTEAIRLNVNHLGARTMLAWPE